MKTVEFVDYRTGNVLKKIKVPNTYNNLFDMFNYDVDIPIYLLYIVNVDTHYLHIDDGLIDINKKIFVQGKSRLSAFSNIEIDRRLSKERANVRIVGKDKFIYDFPDTVQVIELNNVLKDINFKNIGKTELKELYYGFIIKYWPKILSFTMFINILNNKTIELMKSYPLFFPDIQEFKSDIILDYNTWLLGLKYGSSFNIINSINIVDMYNEFVTNENVNPYTIIHYHHPINKKVSAIKVHSLYKTGINKTKWKNNYLVIKIEEYIYEVFSNGTIYVNKQWNIEDKTELDEAKDELNHILLNFIHANKKYIRNKMA